MRLKGRRYGAAHIPLPRQPRSAFLGRWTRQKLSGAVLSERNDGYYPTATEQVSGTSQRGPPGATYAKRVSDNLRRLYNRLDSALDRTALREERRAQHELRLPAAPLRARAALALVLPHARRFERRPILKGVAAETGLQPDGSAATWDFFFDLPTKRAKLAFHLEVDVEDGSSATLYSKAWPYPVANSPFRRMAEEGRILYRQLASHWRQELARTPEVSLSFRDSDAVLADLTKAGLDTSSEFSLSTGVRPGGQQGWHAQTRHAEYWVAP